MIMLRSCLPIYWFTLFMAWSFACSFYLWKQDPSGHICITWLLNIIICYDHNLSWIRMQSVWHGFMNTAYGHYPDSPLTKYLGPDQAPTIKTASTTFRKLSASLYQRKHLINPHPWICSGQQKSTRTTLNRCHCNMTHLCWNKWYIQVGLTPQNGSRQIPDFQKIP